ncbi:hypothetical protein [Roseateles sp.]|uniref:hypothetical protein n=1 Tax=Roseateles sp. TaxID=1971397 RepID=UPI002DF7AA8F|nr:hypothetical protein [Roseateles sp.]
MRELLGALLGATGLALTACGGGSTAGPRLQFSAADSTSRTLAGVVHTHRVQLRNSGDASAHGVILSVSPDARALQLPLVCEDAACTTRPDGGVEIAELLPGGVVTLRQPLRVKPGYRGHIANEWRAAASEGGTSWQQELDAFVADLAVSVGEPTTSATAPQAQTFEVTLSNLGPDEATDVDWELLILPDQVWRVTGCTATGGSTCPATLGAAMKLDRLAAGAVQRLQVQMDEPTSTARPSLGLTSRVAAAGDPDPRNDESSNGQWSGDHVFMTDLEGRQYRLSIGMTGPLRVTGQGPDYLADFVVDVTGQGLLGASGSVTPPWGRGTVDGSGPVMVLGLDIGGSRKPYLAPRKLVTQVSELEGFSFNVLGSRADAEGKPLDAYVGSARFKDGVFELCLPDTPTPVEQCPATRLSRLEAAMVGSEVELVSRDRVMRLRAARSADGPILISSSRDAAVGSSEFWIALPQGARDRFSGGGIGGIHEATFESAAGRSTAAVGDIGVDPSGNPDLEGLRGLPNSALLYASNGGRLGMCGLTSQLSPSPQSGLYEGRLQGDRLGTFQDGQFVKEGVCFAGAIHHVQTGDMAVFLGARDGSLMGRWMFDSR